MDPFGKCPFSLRYCYQCKQSKASEGIIIKNEEILDEEAHDWWSTLQCSVCQAQWFICTTCPKSRVHMKTFDSLRRHYRLQHKKQRQDTPQKTGIQPITKAAFAN
jgi:hypothetical protein